MTSNYSLFYTFDGDVPARFREARVFGANLWTAGGVAMTWGEEARSGYASEALARAAYVAHCQAALDEGYTLARAMLIDPAVFDFALLQSLVTDATRLAVDAVRRAHPGQHIDAFALVSDDSAMTIGPMANSREALAASEYGEEMLWNPAEWAFDDGGAYFDSAYRLLLQAHRHLPFDVDSPPFALACSRPVSRPWRGWTQKGYLARARSATISCCCSRSATAKRWKARWRD